MVQEKKSKTTGLAKSTKEKKSVQRKSTAGTLEIPIYELTGIKKTPVKVSKDIFGKNVSEKLLAQYVRVYLTNQRQGTASTKTRADVVASKRKIYRQKGTGRARHGARSAPIFVGGGVAFGPKSKTFSLRLNKKQKRAAFFGALTKAFEQSNVLGLTDEMINIKPKTKTVVTFLKKLNFEEKQVLLVLPKLEKNNLTLASRNVPNLEIVDARSLNTFLVLRQDKIIFLKNALPILEKHFLKHHEN